jgi:hypothetical protein
LKRPNRLLNAEMEAKEWFLEENKVPASGAMAKYGR